MKAHSASHRLAADATSVRNTEQARVLDGDHGLPGEIAQQLDLPVGEGPHHLSINRDGTDQVGAFEHRHNDDGSSPREIRQGNDDGITLQVSLVLPDIHDVSHLFGPEHLTKAALWMGSKVSQFGRVCECGGHVVGRNLANDVAFKKNHRAEFGPADPGRILQHFLEYGLQLARRAADDLKNFGRCVLPLQCFGELAP